MQHLAPDVRRKAIDVANAVLVEKGDETEAIRIGIARARAWAIRNDIDAERDPDGARPEGPVASRLLHEVHHVRR